ncbi:response regulator [Ketogulonicigenium vulgare]|uniref:Response regulator receiver domain protein n=1 Tax=Ketogulonicigenium vulgare (strain WSH-001) TaxID=759362 RepID=F9Y7G3_KETVW|nr:response regulator [Ketogulonicigenium vulgare]ADO42904.1 chemotaxis two-component response regulator protein [Ketogulonicigenium vulgare Y25]AEM41091.1 response regulator receiver domain protein [Ketogulonicigenium vulgare WSH-001]ALJ81233.1 two-component system response regulator [Ketogulonicigenium vulgare]ANW33973.1 two-component system response regulator [Ketogulonicigenium vulgare]AOZ54814.1 chemotaxis two-component response regulator protein [Ketogulonicigenium vulgare]
MTRILAIDDSPTIRSLVARALRGAGFEVYLAADGVEGVGTLMDADPALIITDVNMPRMDGFGVIEAVRASKSHADVPILVLTTESGDDLKARARSAGATGWLVKPFEDDRLIAVIHRVLGR